MFGQSKPGVEDDILNGDVKAENAIGTMLKLLQELSNFVRRCGDITVNIIHQLASLYHTRTKLYQVTFMFYFYIHHKESTHRFTSFIKRRVPTSMSI